MLLVQIKHKITKKKTIKIKNINRDLNSLFKNVELI